MSLSTNKIYSVIIVLLVLTATSFALTSDQDLPAKLSSNRAVCKHRAQEDICIYSGNAAFTQGTTNLQANTITIHKTAEKIKKIVASGKQSSYSTIIDNGQQRIKAIADLITIEPNKKKIILEKNGKLISNKDEYIGPYIEYKFE